MEVEVDPWLILAILGAIGAVVFATGEFLGWWNDLGEWGFWVSLTALIIGLILTASRRQVVQVLDAVAEVSASTRRIEANTEAIPRIEANTEAIPRIEANTEAIPHIEANTAGLARIEGHTQGIPRLEATAAETLLVLREIRDRLPATTRDG